MRHFYFLFFLLSANFAYAQPGISTPVYHVDTIMFKWTGPVKNQMREGEWTGQGKVFKDKASVNYVAGKREGKWIVFYEDGKVQEQGAYVNDVRDGLWIKYDNLGDTFFLCNYSMGVMNGLYKTYSVGNNLTRMGYFVNGKKEGEWIANGYTVKRQLQSRTTYHYEHDELNGTRVEQTFSKKQTRWYESGVIVKEETLTVTDSAFAPPQQNIDQQQEQTLMFVEEMPHFIGGEPAFQQFLSDSIRYPVTARESRKQGTAYVKFVVEKDGAISEVRLQKGIQGAPELDAEALRVMATMPNWSPGRMNGRAVKVTMTVPVRFAIK